MSLPVRCRVPASFVPVDLDVSPAERAAALPPSDADPTLAGHVEAFVEQMRANRAGFAAMALLPSGRPGYFAITEPPDAPPDLDAMAERLVGSDEVREAELPCGRVIGVTEYATIRTGTVGAVVPVVQEHAWVRHPAGSLVAFTLGVADDRRRPEHVELFSAILSTVRLPLPRLTREPSEDPDDRDGSRSLRTAHIAPDLPHRHAERPAAGEVRH